MPGANRAAQAGEGQITLFEIYSNYNEPVDVASGCIALDYYESILDNTIRASATIVDTGFRLGGSGTAGVEKDDINLTAGEKVYLKISDGNQFPLNFIGEREFRIKQVINIEESTNKLTFSLELFSKESVRNEWEECRVKQRFDGKVSDSIERILKENLKTTKPLDIDPTLNKLSFIGNVEKPFYKCTWLGPRSVPDISNAKGILAGFFFYETYDGFKFKSIDKLFDREPKKNYIFNNVIGELPPCYDGKILDYAFDSTVDLKKSLITGSIFNSKLKGVNTYESAYRENAFDYKSQELVSNLGGKEFPFVAKDLQAQEKITRISYKVDDQGSVVAGKNLLAQLSRSTFVNYNNDEILRQSYVRYNNLFLIKLSIVIAGDMSLRAGDIIFCDFPEVSDKQNTLVSQKKSGVYMIVDICHHISKNSCYTRMNLVRESIYRKSLKCS